ncbi:MULTISPECIES: thioredoxin domain-containing protein [unclassified Isoptericola]|uniref:TlpA family protein disulfide reductase n=1 Tax=unclassified Isoptericola TaxID=2623355 RepID=UPI002712A7B3|nr:MULTISPECIES: thioredoxin domain-containing protein [unclassified Isoptericola]MDO8145250.1 thioredoxin domain-containing protein [Isoptericola sp. 178]MDO8148887.1 thioredoxin domain-containing protein [Isoptericola sp. b515]MDO8151171.1 thioredoxin domain-containing protein [Isoptericola sp. b408]
MRRLAALVIAWAVLTACTGQEPGSSVSVGDDVVGAADAAVAPDVPTVHWFWAPWCPTCQAPDPHLSGLAEQHADQLAVIAFEGPDGLETIEVAARVVPHVTYVVGSEGTLWQQREVTGMSTYTVFGPDGEVLDEGHLGQTDLAELVAGLAEEHGHAPDVTVPNRSAISAG